MFNSGKQVVQVFRDIQVLRAPSFQQLSKHACRDQQGSGRGKKKLCSEARAPAEEQCCSEWGSEGVRDSLGTARAWVFQKIQKCRITVSVAQRAWQPARLISGIPHKMSVNKALHVTSGVPKDKPRISSVPQRHTGTLATGSWWGELTPHWNAHESMPAWRIVGAGPQLESV